MSRKRVSVVIPIYNVADFLEDAIDSALLQDYPDIEVVVVNDGSHEEASKIIARICAKDARIRLVEQPNSGTAQARCNGVKAASGEYIIFLDADDLLLPGAISYLADGLDAHPSSIAVYGKKTRITMQGEVIDEPSQPLPEHVMSGNVLPALLKGAPLFSHGNIGMRKEAIGRVDFPVGICQGEDWVTWCRFALLGDITYIGDKILLYLRVHESNVSNRVFSQPELLFSMLDVVHGDPRFIRLLGEKENAQLRRNHARYIRNYLGYCFADRGMKNTLVKCVSVIIPVYNVVTYLKETIESVLLQDYPDIEIIIVNDGSNTEASKIIEALCAKDARINLITQENMGASLARKNGLKIASGEYIMFLDADDVMLPGAITHLVGVLEANPSAIASYGPKRVIDEKGEFTGTLAMPAPGTALSGNVLPALLKGLPVISNGNICMKQHAINAVDFPADMRNGEDWVVWCQLALRGDIVFAGERIVLHIRWHPDSASYEMINTPEMIFLPLDVIHNDKRFISHVGKKELKHFRHIHIFNIHFYLAKKFRQRGQRYKALKHKIMSKILKHAWGIS